jgi:hypothetical protein
MEVKPGDGKCAVQVLIEFELIALARQGDREAFGELIQRHYHSCVNVATSS